MDQWEKQLRGDRSRIERRNPSFSSTLLDAIYNSIDEGDREIVRKKQSNSSSARGENSMKEEEIESIRRACLINKWMETKVSEKIDIRQNLHNDRSSIVSNSTSKSSNSRCGTSYSSIKAESVSETKPKSRSLISTLKPVRNSGSTYNEQASMLSNSTSRSSNSNRGMAFSSTKSESIFETGPQSRSLISSLTTVHNDHSSLSSNSTSKSSNSSFKRGFSSTKAESLSQTRPNSRSLISSLKSVRNDRSSLLSNSTSKSSDSSCGRGFSFIKPEFVSETRPKSRSLISSLKPLRNNASVRPERSDRLEEALPFEQRKSNIFDNTFEKTKSKALKIYEDLKKVKQPISPGVRIGSFLNSLFNAGNSKKGKTSSSIGDQDSNFEKKSKSEQASKCSSVSSFSRSCLNKTTSNNSGITRSVRFYPVSVIVDENCRPCGHRFLSEDEQHQETRQSHLSSKEEFNFHLMEKNWRVKETSRDHLKGYSKKTDYAIRDLLRINYIDDKNVDDDDDDDDDSGSYSSSDLFELNILGMNSIERYREELPVYETTHLDTNRAIANGLIL